MHGAKSDGSEFKDRGQPENRNSVHYQSLMFHENMIDVVGVFLSSVKEWENEKRTIAEIFLFKKSFRLCHN